MQIHAGVPLYSASDLVDFLACPHLAALKRARAEGRIAKPPPRPASTSDLAASKGLQHEEKHLARLQEIHGDDLVTVKSWPGPDGLRAAAEQTEAAMRGGAPLIYQATFLQPPWMGYADFLERVELDSELGTWSYLPIDTKLALSIKPYFVLQLCCYAELIGSIQGVSPKSLDLILGDHSRHSLNFGEFSFYYRRMAERFTAAIAAELENTYPLPVDHCEVCSWSEPCEEQRIKDDHLSQVANLGASQATKLEAGGIATVAELATSTEESRPRGMSTTTFAKLRSQAALQIEERETNEKRVLLLKPEPPGNGPPRGFALLPAPSEGDLFFDIEGDPFYDEGIEYLWGVSYIDGGEMVFRSFWGLDHSEERRAFEEFVDFVFERRAQYPDMHAYHYAPYERTALSRLMGRYGSREIEVDRLFRERVLVDLYRVVAQSMQISRPSYSLKEVEDFYDQGREADVTQAGDSVLMFERWREDDEPALLEKIEDYNREDCDSTLRLREWLLEQREACAKEFATEIPWRALGEPDEVLHEADEETAELRGRLLANLNDDPGARSPEEANLWLLAQLLDYHRRDAKPGYWEYYDRLERSDTELIEQDSEAIAGLVRVGEPEPLPPPSRSSLQRFQYPPQEHKIGPGGFDDPHSCGIDPQSGESDMKPKSVEVVSIRDADGILELKLSDARLAEEQTALIPGRPYSTPLQRAALRDLANAVLDSGLEQLSTYRVAGEILRRALPRSAAVDSGEPLQGQRVELERVKAIAAGLTDSYLFIQGPPGSGKTYTGAKVILDLIAAGQTIGVTANSHKAINNLLGEIEGRARESGISLRGLKKSSGAEQEYAPDGGDSDGAMIGNSSKNNDFSPGHDYNLIAGTAWLWCREEMRESVDYLVVDEAGQISLADALALSTAARNMILLGDPLQLAQVSQGTHPPGAGASVLEHLLGEEGTIPETRGIFLDQTRRMHPDVCRFVSRAIYEGRLESEPSCANQRIDGNGPLIGTGIRCLPVSHQGNSRQSPEEAEAIAEQIEALDGATFTDRAGETSPLREEQIMIVTPYNAQVRCLREHLDRRGVGGVKIGTVDKFQGQQAAIVFFSMATSSGAQIPRNVEFLYSRNRLNVAVSRAQCVAVLVASPELMSIDCHTVEQMRLVNALCLLDEMGREATSGGVS